MKHIINLGAGVQSSTMALLAAHGEITPMPDAAIFADTGGEPQEVYEWLDYIIGTLPFPVYVVSNGNLEVDTLVVSDHKKGYKYRRSLIPAFIGGHGLLGRTCTADYKIKPIRKKLKELIGLGPNDRWPKETVVTTWLGISLDEIQRMKMQTEPWQDFRHPLIEKRMTRWDCLRWMENQGYPEPPRSACYFCPFHSNDEWRRLTDDEFQKAVEFDEKLRDDVGQGMVDAGHLKGLPYLHRDNKPLRDVDLSTAEDHGQISWLDECAGMCGV